MRILIISVIFSGISLLGIELNAQHDHFSEDDIMTTEGYSKAFPHLAAKMLQTEKELEAFTQSYMASEAVGASRADFDYIIPVVFHVLHEGGSENVSDAVIHDAMRILNEDFQMKNDDISGVVSAFKGITGNARIEFRLARKDPQGNNTTGIDRIYTNRTNNAGESSKLNVWPRNTYMNVWVAKSIGSGAAGYTFLPSGAHWRPSQDGIILLSTYFGEIRTGSARRSRTLTHEVGHWLNLPHVWGGSNNPALSQNCQYDDGVFDTPNTIGWRSCNPSGVTCGSLDNVQNYMDYSYCSLMFTAGQASRMRASLHSRTAQRNELVSLANNKKAGVLDIQVVQIEADKRSVCTGDEVQFEDVSFYDVVAWNWEFEGANIKSSTLKNPKVRYDKPGNYNVKLTVNQLGGQQLTKTFVSYVRVNRSVGKWLPYAENFEEPIAEPYNIWVSENEANDQVQWVIDRGGKGYSGPGFLRLDNFSNLYKQKEAIVSPTVDISNIKNPVLNFYVATANKSQSSSDYIHVYTSNDCGQTWDIKYSSSLSILANGKSMSTAFFPSSPGDWVKVSVNTLTLNDKVQNLMFKFEVTNGLGNNIFIDDINVVGSFDDTPVLEFPQNGIDSVAKTVYLDWKAVPYTDTYEYELSKDPSFTNMISSGSKVYISRDPNNDDTRFLAKDLIPGSTYYWRVRAKRGSLISDWSPVWDFTVSFTGEGVEYIDGEEFGLNAGIENLEKIADIQLLPNPTSQNTRLSFNAENTGVAEVQVFNVQGQNVFAISHSLSQGQNNIELPSSRFEKGVYLVSIKVNNQRTINKLVVQ